MSGEASSSAPKGDAPTVEETTTVRVVKDITLTSTELSTRMSVLTPEGINKIISMTVEVKASSIDITIFSIFNFQGFDPDAIIRKLMVLQAYHGTDDDDLKRDIMMMIAANIYMGNLSGKALGRRSSQGRDEVDYLSSKYQVRIGSTSTGIPSDIVTFPRVAGTFPVLACRMADRLPSKDVTGQAFKSLAVPKLMRMNSFSALCKEPLGLRTRLFLLKSVAAYSCDLSILFEKGRIQKQKKKPKEDKEVVDVKEIAASQWTFIWVASESKTPSIEICRKAFLDFNVSSFYAKLLPVAENYNKIMDDPTDLPTKDQYEKDITEYLSS